MPTAEQLCDIAKDFCHSSLSNYNKWLFCMVENHLGKRVFELGAGPGRFSRFLLKHKLEQLLLLEPSPVFFEEIVKMSREHDEVIAVNCDIEHYDAPHLFESFDSIISIQVFEHIEDDEEAIKQVIRYLRPGGKFICQVPAMKWLYGHWDKEIGHYRRYTKSDVIRLSRSAGLKICESYYFNIVGILGWWLNFCIKKKDFRIESEAKDLSNQGLFFDKWFVPLISFVEPYLRPPIGLGLHFVLEKQ